MESKLEKYLPNPSETFILFPYEKSNIKFTLMTSSEVKYMRIYNVLIEGNSEPLVLKIEEYSAEQEMKKNARFRESHIGKILTRLSKNVATIIDSAYKFKESKPNSGVFDILRMEILSKNHGLPLSKNQLDQKQVYFAMYQLICLLVFFGELGIAHMDIKPGNLLMDLREEAKDHLLKIIDFGAAIGFFKQKYLINNNIYSIDRKRFTQYTPGYAPVETSDKNYNVIPSKVDIYCFAQTFLELLLKACHSNWTLHAITNKQEYTEYMNIIRAELSKYNENHWYDIFERCLRIKSSERPTALEVKGMFKKVLLKLGFTDILLYQTEVDTPDYYEIAKMCENSEEFTNAALFYETFLKDPNRKCDELKYADVCLNLANCYGYVSDYNKMKDVLLKSRDLLIKLNDKNLIERLNNLVEIAYNGLGDDKEFKEILNGFEHNESILSFNKEIRDKKCYIKIIENELYEEKYELEKIGQFMKGIDWKNLAESEFIKKFLKGLLSGDISSFFSKSDNQNPDLFQSLLHCFSFKNGLNLYDSVAQIKSSSNESKIENELETVNFDFLEGQGKQNIIKDGKMFSFMTYTITSLAQEYYFKNSFKFISASLKQYAEIFKDGIEVYKKIGLFNRSMISCCLMFCGNIFIDAEDYITGLRFLEEAEVSSKSIYNDENLLLVNIYINISNALALLNLFDKAFKYLDDASKTYERIQKSRNPGFLSVLHYHKGLTYIYKGDFEKDEIHKISNYLTALKELIEAEKLCEECRDKSGIAIPPDLYSNISKTYYKLKKFVNGNEYLNKLARVYGVMNFMDSEQIARNYYKIGKYKKSFCYYKISIILQDKPDIDCAHKAITNYYIAKSLFSLSKYRISLEYCNLALNGLKEKLTKNELMIFKANNLMGRLYCKLNDYGKAKSIFESQNSYIFSDVNVKSPLEDSAILRKLSTNYFYHGNAFKEEEFLIKAYKNTLQKGYENNLILLKICYSLGIFYFNQHKYNNQLLYFKKCRQCQITLDITSKSVIKRSVNIVNLLYNAGFYKECIEFGTEYIKSLQESSYIDTIRIYQVLAKSQCDLDKYNEAIEYCSMAYSLATEKLKYTDFVLFSELNSIYGKIFIHSGDYENAENYLDKAYEYYKKSSKKNAIFFVYLFEVFEFIGEYQLLFDSYKNICDSGNLSEFENDIGVIYLNIGKAYNNTGEFEQALDYCLKAEKILITRYGEKIVYLNKTYETIGSIYNNLKDSESAIKSCEKSLKITEDNLGNGHSLYGKALITLAVAYNNNLMYDKSIETSKNSLKILEKIYSKDHIIFSDIEHNFGESYTGLGDNSKALKCFEKELEHKIKFYGENHVSLGEVFICIANIYKQLDYELYLQNLESAAKIYEKSFRKGHPKTIELFLEVSQIYAFFGNKEMAASYEEKADDATN